MAIAITIQDYLDELAVPFETITHRRTGCSSRTADVANIEPGKLAKAVFVRRKGGYLMAIVPASRKVQLDKLGSWLKQPVALATEEEISELLDDCEPGAIPPLAAAYGLRSVLDESLEGRDDIYFEGGDHRTLVHVTGAQFTRLMAKVPHASISRKAH